MNPKKIECMLTLTQTLLHNVGLLRADRQADSSIPLKTFLYWKNKKMTRIKFNVTLMFTLNKLQIYSEFFKTLGEFLFSHFPHYLEKI